MFFIQRATSFCMPSRKKVFCLSWSYFFTAFRRYVFEANRGPLKALLSGSRRLISEEARSGWYERRSRILTDVLDGINHTQMLLNPNLPWNIWWAEPWLMFKEDATSCMMIRLSVITISLAFWILTCVVEVDGRQAFCVTLVRGVLNFSILIKDAFTRYRTVFVLWWMSPMYFNIF